MSLFGKTYNSFEDLFVGQIEDLYDAEHRIIKALPKMIEAASSPNLKQALQMHLNETQQQVRRLESVFQQINRTAERETCDAMKGLLSEAEEMISADAAPDVKDAALIAAAQRVEHYEISGYGTARTFAQRLDYTEAATLLQQTMQEEIAADKKLTEIAESSVNVRAAR